jgi:hypothetical protein
VYILVVSIVIPAVVMLTLVILLRPAGVAPIETGEAQSALAVV